MSVVAATDDPGNVVIRQSVPVYGAVDGVRVPGPQGEAKWVPNAAPEPLRVDSSSTQADATEVNEAIDRVSDLLEEVMPPGSDRRDAAAAVVTGLLALGYDLTPPERAGTLTAAATVEWAVRVPGFRRPQVMAERVARAQRDALPGLELVGRLVGDWETRA